MTYAYLKLAGATILPVIVAVIFYLLDTKTGFGKWNKVLKQIIYGIVFGAIAVFGTEFGIPVEGAQINCRDGAVMIAGLFFGSPAGIIAGLIGGIERWIAVAWGIGSFTRIACSVSTALAGVVAALLRKFFFEGRYPGAVMGLASGMVMETFHMTMVFLTNVSEIDKAVGVIQACLVPMVIGNGIAVMLAAFLFSLLTKEKGNRKKDSVKITDTIQRALAIVIIVAFIFSSMFMKELLDQSSLLQTEKHLMLAAEDVENDINDAIERSLKESAEQIREKVSEYDDLEKLAREYQAAEINVVDKNGKTVRSSNPSYVGYDMSMGYQTRAFLVLLDGNTQYYSQEYGEISYNPELSRKYVGIATDEGFIQIGYDAKHFQKLTADKVVDSTSNRHVGENGFVIIFDNSRTVVSAPNFIESNKFFYVHMLGQFEELPKENEVFLMDFDGSTYYARYHNLVGYTVLTMMDEAEAVTTRITSNYASNFIEVLIYAILFVLIYQLIKQVVIKQLRKVTRSLKKITGGDLNEVVNVRTNAEFSELSDDINATVDTLKKYIDEAAARIDADLAMAKEIQASALPSVFPAFPKRKDFDIYALMDTAKEVGGDFYDFYMTQNNIIHILIADVSGKGIPAAMFMMRAKTQLQSLTKAEKPINEVFQLGNDALCEGNDAGMFVTAWQGGINLDTGLVEFANGGHNPPLVKRSNGQFEYLKKKVNLVLAGMPDMPYSKQEFRLYPGDTLFLYTDGVTEATDANNQLYGEDRLRDALNSKEFKDMKELCDYVKVDVDKFVGDAPQFDDITMVAFKFNGQQEDGNVILEEKKTIAVPAKVDFLDSLMSFVDKNLEDMDCPMRVQTQIDIAVDEIFANIASYSYPDGEGDFVVEMYPCKENIGVVLKFIDTGIPYNPLLHEDPDITLSAEERGIGGLGILMVKKTMTNVEYEYTDGKNILTLTKHFA